MKKKHYPMDLITSFAWWGRFIIEGVVDFQEMQHTLASLWKPGKGVHVKEIETNLYVFQFFHEIDLKRVVEGSPWSFSHKVLIIARMKEGEVPTEVKLNALYLWVQIYDLRVGFMTEKVLKEIGNFFGIYIDSCSSILHEHEGTICVSELQLT